MKENTFKFYTKVPKMKLPSGLTVLYSNVNITGIYYHRANFAKLGELGSPKLYATFDTLNVYDSNAISIYAEIDGENLLIGYLPKEIAASIADLPQDAKENLYIRTNCIVSQYKSEEFDNPYFMYGSASEPVSIWAETKETNDLASVDILLKKADKELDYNVYPQIAIDIPAREASEEEEYNYDSEIEEYKESIIRENNRLEFKYKESQERLNPFYCPHCSNGFVQPKTTYDFLVLFATLLIAALWAIIFFKTTRIPLLFLVVPVVICCVGFFFSKSRICPTCKSKNFERKNKKGDWIKSKSIF